MTHDISRDSYASNSANNADYLKVRRQQGRLFSDADFNEQIDLLFRDTRNFRKELIGPYAGPKNSCGFVIQPAASTNESLDFAIGPGSYYVDGVRIENRRRDLTYATQLELGIPPIAKPAAGTPLVFYLDLQTVPFTPIDDLQLNDVAFEGRSSSNREAWLWRVRAGGTEISQKDWPNIVNRGMLNFYSASQTLGTCVTDPGPVYTGSQDQLYRVEVHQGLLPAGDSVPRFKWSRDNAAPMVAVKRSSENAFVETATGWTVQLRSLSALEGRRSLQPLCWVEPKIDARAFDVFLPLLWVESVDPDHNTATLSLGPNTGKSSDGQTTGPMVNPASLMKTYLSKISRLVIWDHTGRDSDCNGVPLKPLDKTTQFGAIILEHGIQVIADMSLSGPYLPGDYWQFAARIGSSISVFDPQHSTLAGPTGPERLRAPLAEWDSGTGKVTSRLQVFSPLAVAPVAPAAPAAPVVPVAPAASAAPA